MDSRRMENGNEASLLANCRKVLQVPVPPSPTSPLSPTPSLRSSTLSTASSSSSEDLLAAAGTMDHLDSFLQEALNSRNRITVLRLEQEIEKFAVNSKLQQLLLRPMLSSYERLAAHRVAHYYSLLSMAIESNDFSGSRILLLKTPDSKLPSVRLVHIPVTAMQNDKPASPPLGKVAIKQRTNQAISNNGDTYAGRIMPPKSVEERTEEYNKARARIFSCGDLTSGKDSQAGAVSREEQHTMGELPVSREVMSIGSERDHHEDESVLRVANTVAVFRDREKDIKDPDYDRSYGRYSPPLRAGSAMSVKPLVVPRMCSSSSGMLGQGGIGNIQPRVDSAMYSVFGYQDGPWTGLAGLPVLGYPCALPGPCMQSHSLSNPYPPTQKLVHPGYHSITNLRELPTKVNSHPMPSAHVMDWFRSY